MRRREFMQRVGVTGTAASVALAGCLGAGGGGGGRQVEVEIVQNEPEQSLELGEVTLESDEEYDEETAVARIPMENVGSDELDLNVGTVFFGADNLKLGEDEMILGTAEYEIEPGVRIEAEESIAGDSQEVERIEVSIIELDGFGSVERPE